ncbi:MAG: hypothetical protein R3F49_09500 [Planctomycetota bacterium]
MIGGVGLRLGAMYLLTGRWFPPDYRKLALEGQPLVQAIDEFKLHTGLWPDSLDELVPDFLSEKPPGYWEFQWPTLCLSGVMPHTGILYTFCPPDIGWSSDGDFGKGPISLPKPVTTLSAPPPQERFENGIAVLERRIRLNPGHHALYRDKVTYLVHQERQAEAVAAAREAAEVFPDDWWPQMALAELARGVAQERSSAAFADWADQHPNFNNYWYLFEYRRQHHELDAALDALERAAIHTVVRDRDYDRYTPDYFCFTAAAYACRLQKPELTLRLCEQWDRMSKERGYGGKGDMALRAAAYLNLGRTSEAQACVRQAIEEQWRQAGWPRDLGRLSAAAQAGEIDFVYDAEMGGSVYTPLRIFEAWGLDE